MNILGIIGGMSIESTLIYYREIDRIFRRERPGVQLPSLLIANVDFEDICRLQRLGDWETLSTIMITWRDRLLSAGCQRYLIATNTMHYAAPYNDPRLLHIVDAVGEHCRRAGITKVGLLGTRFTLVGDFYRRKLLEDWGVESLIPNEQEIEDIHSIIFNELCQGVVLTDSKERSVKISDRMMSNGAEGILLACTELGMLMPPGSVPYALLDSTTIHAEAGARWLLD